MMNSDVVLTYKRKRLSSQAHLAHDVKAANSSPDSPRGVSSGRLIPKAESDSYNEKLNEDTVNISQEKGQCSALIRRHDAEESMQQQGQEKKGTRKKKSIEKSEMGPMELRSHKVLLSRKLLSRKASPSATNACFGKTADSFLLDISCNNSGSACEDTCVEGSSKLVDLDTLRRSIPVCLNTTTESNCSSGCPEAPILRTFNSDNVVFNEEHPKENSSTPLITFCRRVKKKQITCETSSDRNLKTEENQCSSGNWSNHALGTSCRLGNSSQKCNIKDQPTPAADLLEQVDPTPLQMADADEDAHLECAPVGGHAEYVHEDPSDKHMVAPTADAIRDSISMHEKKQSDLAEAGTASKEELRKNLAMDVNNPEKAVVPYDASEERLPLSDLNLAVAPDSPPCPSKEESNKPSVDMPENLQDSRSSSTPSCAMVVDEEADGRGKELEWLENLEKALQETKKNRNTFPFREQGGSNCGQASNGKDPPVIPINSSMQSPCNQDEARGHMNQMSHMQERVFLTRLIEPGSEKQQLEVTSNRSSHCTNFLLLNSEASTVSAKEFQNMPSRPSLGLKGTDRPLWHALNESSSLRRQKQIVEDVETGTGILKERRGSLLDKYKRYLNDWSEEELDYLWIGVRRHGIYNWYAMLRDPKLRFSESRVADDLAKRWDLEQRKLLNGTLIQPVSLSRPVLSSSSVMDDAAFAKTAAGNHYGGYGAWSQGYSEFPIPAAETKLSLGDIYLQKESILKRSPFYSSSPGTADLLTSAGPSTISFLSTFPVGPTYPMAGIRQQKPTRAECTRFDWESSTSRHRSGERSSHERQYAGPPSSSTLPHWLKEVIDTPPGPSRLVLPPISTIAQSANLLGVSFPNLGEQPASPKDGRGRGILKRKRLGSGNNAHGFRVSDVVPTREPLVGARVGPLPYLGLASQRPAPGVTGPDPNNIADLNKRSLGPIGPSDLVVIESDASSEETISDDQS